jgi:amino acid permease
MSRLYIKGIGMMVGMIFGAGIFALPYVFSKAGLFWGIAHLVISFLLLLFLHLLYAEISYFTKGRHRFTGYVEIFLGKTAKQFAFITTVLSYYGSILVYGLLSGILFSNFFGGSYRFEISLLFFIVTGFFIFLKMTKIAEINFYLTVPIFCFIIYLIIVALPSVKIDNFLYNLNFDFKSDWFLPYGVWLFALCGFAAVPEVRDIFFESKLKYFKRTIIMSLVLSAIFYSLFVFAVWGASNDKTTQDALTGILYVLGQKAFIIGSLIGFLAVFTSCVSMAIDMRNIFRFDYKLPRTLSIFLTMVPPVILFLLGTNDFVRILDIIGALGLGSLGVFIILMTRKLRERLKNKDTELISLPEDGEYMKPRLISQALVLVGILVGVIIEL